MKPEDDPGTEAESLEGWDDAELDEMLNIRSKACGAVRTARKPYTCNQCGRPIPVGSSYRDLNILLVGHERTCLRCSP